MRRSSLLTVAAVASSALLAGTFLYAPAADAQGPSFGAPPPKGPIVKGPVPAPKMVPLPPPKIKPLPPPKIKPLPLPKKPLPPPPPPKKGPPPPPKGGWIRPYILPPIGFWLWNGVTIHSYDYDGCGYEYYKWRTTGSSYWRRMYRQCRDWD